MKLDKNVVSKLSQPMWRTWNEIASDVEACGGRMSNGVAVESCIDADRLLYNGHSKDASDLITALCKEHGYMKVHRFLCRNFKLY